jgi:hypothetical protein
LKNYVDSVSEEIISLCLDEGLKIERNCNVWKYSINSYFSDIKSNHSVNFIIGIYEGIFNTKETIIKDVFIIKEKGESFILVNRTDKFIDYHNLNNFHNIICIHEPCQYIFFSKHINNKLVTSINGYYFGKSKGLGTKTNYNLDVNGNIYKVEIVAKIFM